MNNVKVSDFSNNIFEMSEITIYNVIEKFSDSQTVDKTLTYVFIKAFYIHMVRIYLSNKNNIDIFENIINEYRNRIVEYYKYNNEKISNTLLEDILNAFNASFNIVESIDYKDLNDGYELRHHVINSFELLRVILMKKSKTNIRVDIFENSISEIRNQAEKILDYTANCKIIQ